MKKLIRILSLGLLSLIVVLIITFFYINSDAFIKQCILPLLGRVMDTEVTVQEVHFSFFEGLDLINLRIGSQNKPFLSASRAKISSNIFRKKNRRVDIEDILLEDVVIHLRQNEDGHLHLPSLQVSALDAPFLSLLAAPYSKFNVNDVRVNNLAIFYNRQSEDETQTISIAISELDGFLDSWIEEETFEMNAKAALQMVKGDHIHLESQFCTLALTGLLGDDRQPEDLTLSLRLDQVSGHVGFLPIKKRSIHYDLNIERDTPQSFKIRHCNLSELLNNEVEGYVSVTGNLSTIPRSFDLELVIATERPGLLSPILTFLGPFNFGETLIDYQAKVLFDETSSLTSIRGGLTLTNFTASTDKTKSSELHPINLSFDHTLSYNSEEENLRLDRFNLVAMDNSKEIATAALDRPVSLSLKELQTISPPPTLTMTVRNLDLDILNPFLSHVIGFELENGALATKPDLKIVHTGQLIAVHGGLALSDGTIRVEDREYQRINMDIFHQFNFDKNTKTLTIQHCDSVTKIHEDMALEINLNGFVNLDHLHGSLTVNKLKTYPEIQMFMPEKFRMAQEVNNFNCHGNFRIGFKAGDHVIIEGTLASENVSLSAFPSQSLLPISPTLDLHIIYNLQDSVQLGHNVLTVESPIGQLATIAFHGELDYPISYGKVTTEINLDRLGHLSTEPHAPRLSDGYLSGSFQVLHDDRDNKLFCHGDMQLCDIITSDDFGEPKTSIDTDIHLNVDYSRWKTLTVHDLNVWTGNQANTYLDLDITGRVYLGPAKAPSILHLRSLAPLDIEKFFTGISTFGISSNAQLKSNNERIESSTNTPKQRPEPKLELTLNLDIPQLYYNDITIQELTGRMSLNQKKITLNLASDQFNDGQLLADLFCDRSLASFLECNGKVLFEDVDLEPLFSSFNLGIEGSIAGCVDTFDLTLIHAALGMASPVKNFQAKTFLELENARLTMPTHFESFLNLFALEPDHLFFDTIVAQSVANEDSNTLELVNANGQMLKLRSSGHITFNDTWLPDLTLTIGYSEALATLARKKHIKITQNNDDFYYTNPLPITVRSWEKSDLFNDCLPKLTTSLFDLDPKTMNIILRVKQLGETFGDQSILEDTLGGLWNILNTTDKTSDR